MKKMVALFLVLLLSIESFAAVVGDNDGSAFITKAEFDSLKNNFQSQIDQYNTSIDSKIDGAIASYLAGIYVAKVSKLSLLVENYDDMKWKRKWEIFGGYKKWTNASNIYTANNNTWYTPHYQNFHYLRWENRFQIDALKLREHGGVIAHLEGAWDRSTSVRWVSDNDCSPTSTFQKFAISCDGSKDNEIVLREVFDSPNPGFENFSKSRILLYRSGDLGRIHAPNDVEDQPDYYISGSWTVGVWDAWGAFAYGPAPDGSMSPVETIPDTDPGSILSAYIYLRRQVSSTDGQLARLKVQLTDKHMEAWEHYGDCSMDTRDYDSVGASNITSSSVTYSSGFWSEPFYWEAIDNTTASTQENDLKYLMLGKDFDWQAPIYRVDPNQIRSGFLKFGTTFADFDSLNLKVNRLRVGGVVPYKLDNNYDVTYTNTTPLTWRSPNLEKYDFNKISSGIFKLNGNNLKFGQGLPITTNVPNTGRFVIEFDYSIGRTTGDVPTSATGIELDLKSSDFLTPTGTYYKGLLNSETTEKTFQNLEVDNTSNHVKLVVDNIKENQEVWLRIAPKDTSGGLYAQISNLKASVEAE